MLWAFSQIKFDGNSSVAFNDNEASFDGGAVYCTLLFCITFVAQE